MFKETKNTYKFKYLQTGISGDGIPCVYLPEKPKKNDPSILRFPDKKWQKTPLPVDWKKWRKEEAREINLDPDYVHPQIQAHVQKEWDRRLNGVWIEIKNEIIYITGLHYYYLQHWKPNFDVNFRAIDVEVFYWIQYWEEDPSSYGGCLNTLRRFGKSAIMGCWIIEKITRNKFFYGGMQGETDDKIKDFFDIAVVQPFRKLDDYFLPIYDTGNAQSKIIKLSAPVKRGKKLINNDDEEVEALESAVDYRNSDVTQYDGKKLHAYIAEEAGKTKKVCVYERHDIVKPCLKRGIHIIGKAFYATTVDLIESAGGRYKELFNDSDFNNKQGDGKTISGLYAAFIPASCGLEGMVDEYGYPMIEEAEKHILLERQSYIDRPSKLAGLIRKYPLNIREAFWVTSDKCIFNSMILQERLSELQTKTNILSRGDFEWQGGIKDSKVIFVPNNNNGKFLVPWLPEKDSDTNKVSQAGTVEGVIQWKPLNDDKFAIGTDPIQHFTSSTGKRSRPATMIKRKLDLNIDVPTEEERGLSIEDLLDKRAKEKYNYKTGVYIGFYDYRPDDPNVYFENMIKLCRFFGCSIHIEKQYGAGLINYMITRGYGAFIAEKYRTLLDQQKKHSFDQGTHASTATTQEFTTYIERDVIYFGHTYKHKDHIEDLLAFDPTNTRDHDWTMAHGYTELQCRMPVNQAPTPVELESIFSTFNNSGNTSKRIR